MQPLEVLLAAGRSSPVGRPPPPRTPDASAAGPRLVPAAACGRAARRRARRMRVPPRRPGRAGSSRRRTRTARRSRPATRTGRRQRLLALVRLLEEPAHQLAGDALAAMRRQDPDGGDPGRAHHARRGAPGTVDPQREGARTAHDPPLFDRREAPIRLEAELVAPKLILVRLDLAERVRQGHQEGVQLLGLDRAELHAESLASVRGPRRRRPGAGRRLRVLRPSDHVRLARESFAHPVVVERIDVAGLRPVLEQRRELAIDHARAVDLDPDRVVRHAARLEQLGRDRTVPSRRRRAARSTRRSRSGGSPGAGAWRTRPRRRRGGRTRPWPPGRP